jgi:hypothetical protein
MIGRARRDGRVLGRALRTAALAAGEIRSLALRRFRPARLPDAVVLPARARRVLASLVPVVCPEGAVRLGLTEWLVDHAELSASAFPAVLRRGLALGLTTYDVSAAAWPRARGRSASRLDPVRAAAWFRLWWRSPLPPQRELAKAVKSLLCLAYYEAPEVQAEMGYTPQAWIDRVARRRLELYRDDIDRHQESLVTPDPLPSSLAARRAAAREAG